MTRQLVCTLAALALLGCGSTDEEEAAPRGTATLAFSVTNGVKVNPNLQDPLMGSIYGAVFVAEDVQLTGPKDGAEERASVELPGVDLEANTVSDQTWKSPPLPPGKYMFLGFMDLDGNGADTKEPDVGDPVTLPINEFEIKADQDVQVEVAFDLVLG